MEPLVSTWPLGMISYARIIADETLLPDAWLKGDKSRTSIFYPGELFSQLFDGMRIHDSDAALSEVATHNQDLANSIARFIESLMVLEAWAKARPHRLNPVLILGSELWGGVVSKAQDVLRDSEGTAKTQ